MGIIDLLSNGLKAVANYFGWAQQRDAEKNSPAMQANAAANTEAQIKDKVASAEAAADKGDDSEAEKLAAE